MSQAEQAQQLKNRVKEFSNTYNLSGISPDFLRQVGDIDTSEGFPGNAVVDISVFMNGPTGRMKRLKADIDRFSDEEWSDIENFFGDRLAYHYKPDEDLFIEKSTPVEDYDAIADLLSHGVEIYYPNHLENCLEGIVETVYRGTEVYEPVSNLSEDIVEKVPEFAGELDVWSQMNEDGLYEGWKVHRAGTEDGYMEDAIDELDGDTMILTYDSDWLDSGYDSLPPSFAQQALANTVEDHSRML